MNQRILISGIVTVIFVVMVGVMLQQEGQAETSMDKVAVPLVEPARAEKGQDKVVMERSYDEALAKAKQLGRPLMLIVSSLDCRYCDIFDNETLASPLVAKALNRDFVTVELYPGQGQAMPAQLNTGSTPTIWFLTPDGKPMFAPLMGALPKEEFLKALAIVHESFEKSKT